MGEEKKKGNDWDFKVEKSDLKEAERATTPRPSKPKKRIPKAKKSLKVDNSRKETMTRTARAKCDTELDRLAALKSPSVATRIKASLYDAALIAIIVGATYYFKEDLNYHYVKLLADNGINQTLHPDLLNQILVGGVSFVGVLLFYIFPTLSSRRSPGKKVERIRIGSGEHADTVSGSVAFIREIILKPISVASVIGILLSLKAKRGRGLHDLILGTTLYNEDSDDD